MGIIIKPAKKHGSREEEVVRKALDIVMRHGGIESLEELNNREREIIVKACEVIDDVYNVYIPVYIACKKLGFVKRRSFPKIIW